MAKTNETDGVWRTVGGRRIFIKTGQSLSDAMKQSGKFKKSKNRLHGPDSKEVQDINDRITKEWESSELEDTKNALASVERYLEKHPDDEMMKKRAELHKKNIERLEKQEKVKTLSGKNETDNKGREVSQEEYDEFRQAYKDGKISQEDYRNDNYDALKNIKQESSKNTNDELKQKLEELRKDRKGLVYNLEEGFLKDKSDEEKLKMVNNELDSIKKDKERIAKIENEALEYQRQKHGEKAYQDMKKEFDKNEDDTFKKAKPESSNELSNELKKYVDNPDNVPTKESSKTIQDKYGLKDKRNEMNVKEYEDGNIDQQELKDLLRRGGESEDTIHKIVKANTGINSKNPKVRELFQEKESKPKRATDEDINHLFNKTPHKTEEEKKSLKKNEWIQEEGGVHTKVNDDGSTNYIQGVRKSDGTHEYTRTDYDKKGNEIGSKTYKSLEEAKGNSGNNENSFKMYNSQYDKEVTVKKGADGKWVDSDGNKYMGYLSKDDVKKYFKGNWQESKETRSAGQIISDQMSKTAKAQDETAKALGIKRDKENGWKTTAQLYKEQKGKDLVETAINSKDAKKYNDYVEKHYSWDDKNFSDRKAIDEYAKANNLDADSLYYMTKIASASDKQKLKKASESTKNSGDWVRNAFNDYKKQHPRSKMTLADFKKNSKK